MAAKISTELEDDLDGGPAIETVRFGIGGAEYEIDLSAKNASAFRGQIAPFVEHARRANARQRRRAVRTAASRERSARVRAWARGQGLDVSERGRIPTNVVKQYDAVARSR